MWQPSPKTDLRASAQTAVLGLTAARPEGPWRSRPPGGRASGSTTASTVQPARTGRCCGEVPSPRGLLSCLLPGPPLLCWAGPGFQLEGMAYRWLLWTQQQEPRAGAQLRARPRATPAVLRSALGTSGPNCRPESQEECAGEGVGCEPALPYSSLVPLTSPPAFPTSSAGWANWSKWTLTSSAWWPRTFTDTR